jgi:hypothetical protein
MAATRRRTHAALLNLLGIDRWKTVISAKEKLKKGKEKNFVRKYYAMTVTLRLSGRVFARRIMRMIRQNLCAD